MMPNTSTVMNWMLFNVISFVFQAHRYQSSSSAAAAAFHSCNIKFLLNNQQSQGKCFKNLQSCSNGLKKRPHDLLALTSACMSSSDDVEEQDDNNLFRNSNFYSDANDNISDNDERDDDDDDNNKPYRNRSVFWTNKYRNLFPYEYARMEAIGLGLRSKEEWDEYIEDGKVYHGPYLPSYPDIMYSTEWESWDEFLGIIRPYNDTRHMIRSLLCIQNREDYYTFINTDRKRAAGLRIPAKPELYYKDDGWISWEHFFAKE